MSVCLSVCLCVCVSVCLSVCLLSHILPKERLFTLKTLSRTQRATKVKNIVGFSLKPFRCRDTALAALYRYPCSRTFLLRGKCACAYLTTPRALELALLRVRASLRSSNNQNHKAVYENLCTQDKVINATPSYKAKLDCLTTALWKNADFLRNKSF